MLDLNTNDKIGLADWVELNVIFSKEFISKSKIRSSLDSTNLPFQSNLIDDVFAELSLRLEYYGQPAPYQIVDSNRIEPLIDWQDFPDLVMCLWLAYNGAGNESGHEGATKLFELISQVAVDNYLNGNSILLGFPNKISLPDLIKNVCFASFEEIGELSDLKPTDNDRGVDIIAWKSFEDNRPSQLFMLIQCASGQNWHTKANPPHGWYNYIKFASGVFNVGFTINELITDNFKWRRLNNDNHRIIFDRARIYRLLRKNEPSKTIKSKLITWCENKIEMVTN